MKIRFTLAFLAICIFALVVSCNTSDSSDSTKLSSALTSSRPYNPWVFRSVLDARPRMITFALDDNLYAAYSTQTGALYKTWKGNVQFEGAVYNSAHGPQPVTLGDAYFINTHEKPWIVTSNGEATDYSLKYKGHTYTDADHAFMSYEFNVAGQKFTVTETPDVKNNNGKIVFTRSFATSGVPKGMEIALKTNLSSVILEDMITTNGKWTLENKSERGASVKVLDLDGILTLNSNAETTFDLQLSDKVLITNPNNSLFSAADLAGNEGKELIGKNDCKSCHNTHVKTIGPAYSSIAKKYANTADNVNYLVGKVINGGSGVWGNVLMTAHPELPREDAESMVQYIMDLDKDTEVAGEEKTDVAIPMADYFEPETTEEKGLSPGTIVKIYNYKGNVKSMPDFSKLSPIEGGIMPNLGNIEGGDFTGHEFNFGLTAEGYLHIENDNEVSFRTWSDDGSILYIDDKKVVDNDGNHGTEYKENTIGMKAGYHKFRIEFYQGGGGSYLSFNWKPEANGSWEVVPIGVLSHKIDARSAIDGLTLPMSSKSKIPGMGVALESMHPSFDLTQARPEGFLPKVGGLDVLKDGRIILSTWDPDGAVFIVDYKGKAQKDITYKKIAHGLAEPLGVKVVGDDIFVMQKQEITQLIDNNNDEIIDEYKVLTNDWDVSANFHEFGFGLEEKEGHLYATLAIGIMPGGASAKNQPKDRGKVMKVNIESGEIEFLATGLRTPNGIGQGYNGEIFVADNQGDWLPASKILHITKGAFFNSRAVDFEGTKNTPVKAPVVWLPQNDVGNSPSTPTYLNIGPFKNQMIHGEVTHGGLKRVFLEEVNGELQGSLFRFAQGFEAGVNRVSWADEGTLIVGGIGNPGNWQHSGKKWYGLQELKYNGKKTFEILAVRAKTNGMELEFTEPLKTGDGWDPSSYLVEQWYYKPTPEYGGPKLDQRELRVKSATVNEDRTRVFLEIVGMKKEHVVHILMKEHFASVNDNDLWNAEAWYTLNNIPQNTLGI